MGTVFGFAVGDLDPAAVLAALEPVLGPPTRDTGVYMTAGGGEGDCIGGRQQRVLRWGDLAFAFWPTDPAGITTPVLWSWTVGDPAASGWGDLREPPPVSQEPSLGLSSAAGIRVGATVEDLVKTFGSSLALHGSTGAPTDAGAATFARVEGVVGFSLKDGRATGIGSTLAFC